MSADVFFIAGEASGDLHAALVTQRLRSAQPGLSVEGIGGERMRAAGISVTTDSSDWGSIGPLSAASKIPRLLAHARRLSKRLQAAPPRVLVPIDFGAYNLRVLTWLREAGYRGKVIYYFPPGAWLDKPGQARVVAAHSTPLVPFAHQHDFYRSLGLDAQWFGHPLASVVADRGERAVSARIRIAVLPGSRVEEVRYHVPPLARAAAMLARSAEFDIVASSQRRAQQIEHAWRACGGPDSRVTIGDVTRVLRDADAGWIASGTAVLEAALCGVPQLSFYRVSAVQAMIGRRILPKIAYGHFTLPNLVTGRSIVPELRQEEMTPNAIVAVTAGLLESDAVRRAQREGYAEMRALLGPADALERIAAFIGAAAA